jgi:hypothetical protein
MSETDRGDDQPHGAGDREETADDERDAGDDTRDPTERRDHEPDERGHLGLLVVDVIRWRHPGPLGAAGL